MKTYKKIILTLMLPLAIFSCSDSFYDKNESQDNPSTSTPELTLPVAQKTSADYFTGGYFSLNTLGNIWAYQWAAAGDFIFFTDEMQYNVTSSFRTGSFNTAYLLPLNNYNFVENFGGAEYNNYKAIAKIMKAFHFQYLVDMYGSVPYTEAFQRGENTTPVYDSGEFVYNAIYGELNAAIDLITASQGDTNIREVGSEDVMLQGNMTMWAKFANTIKLKILLRQSNTSTDFSAQYLELSTNSYGFLNAGEDVTVNPGYLQEAGKQNPLWNAFGETEAGNLAGNNEATKATDYVIEKLQDEFFDPRLDNLYAPATATGTFVGNAQNNQNATAPKTAELSGIGPGVLQGFDQDAIIMQSAESLFLQAEAVLNGDLTGNVSGSAQDLYESAIAESFIQLLETSSPAAYYSQPIQNVSWNASAGNELEAIITQKWIALNGTNGIENWIEYKRTGFPADLPAAPDALSTTIPVRLLYPSSEQATNAANVPSQTTSDAFTKKVFWDN